MTTNATSPVTWTTETATVCGGQVSYQRAGRGAPLLVLPRENGHPPRNEFLDLMSAGYTVYYPWYPGFHGGGDPADWEWLANARDLAIVQLQLARAIGLERFALAGLGFGGWIAAEMATMCAPQLDALVLVAPMGVRPGEGYIYDQFLVSTEAYARHAFADQTAFDAIYGSEPDFDQLESWETDREMTSRLAWKPYMHNRTLPRLLNGVACPSLVVWGDQDKVVPPGCGELYRSALPDATLDVIPNTGHAVDLEAPGALAASVRRFLTSASRS
ncbi:MAG: alpha/beta fold hydrolase [Dehalococcoidia bacterium]